MKKFYQYILQKRNKMENNCKNFVTAVQEGDVGNQ